MVLSFSKRQSTSPLRACCDLTAADAHERMGDLAGARERKRLIAELKRLKSEMLLLAEAERDGRWTPNWKNGPSLAAQEAVG